MYTHSVSSYLYTLSGTSALILKEPWLIHFSLQLVLRRRAKYKASDILKRVTETSGLGRVKCSLAACCHINYGVQHQFSLLCHEPTLSPFTEQVSSRCRALHTPSFSCVRVGSSGPYFLHHDVSRAPAGNVCWSQMSN